MGLRLQQLSLTNFRNYDSLLLRDIGALTIFVGPNAVGKTNIIEGIDLLTAISSFRHPKIQQIMKWDSDFTRLQASLTDGSRELEITLQIQEAKKTYQLNGKVKRIHDLKGILPAVCFSPDDLNLIKGSQSIKRNAIDLLGSQLSANYYAVRKDYEKILRQKNRVLKEGVQAEYLASINEVLISIGAQLSFKRAEVFSKLSPYICDYYHMITGCTERVELAYIPSWEESDQEVFTSHSFTTDKARQSLQTALVLYQERERESKRTLLGPQNDTIEFFIEGKNAGIYGSQGQQRSLVLSFKLAEVSLIQNILGQKPVLLLDDVMSELDSVRRTALIQFISDDIQTFITTTHLEYFSEELLTRAHIIHLDKNQCGMTVVN